MDGAAILDYRSYWLLVYAGILATTCIAIARHRRPATALGIGLMTAPLWMAAWTFLNSIPVVLDPSSDVGTASPRTLSRMFYLGALRDLGFMGAGFLLWSTDGRPWLALRDGVRGLAARLAASGLPLRGREGASAAAGWLTFPALLAGAAGLDWLVSRTLPSTGTEDAYFALMTPYHAIMVSLTAALTEELAYRGVLMVGLLRLLSRDTSGVLAVGMLDAWRGTWPGPRRILPTHWSIAIVVQAVVFGLAHAGYGTIQHIIVPVGFALVAGVAAWRLGIWAAIALHFLVDLYVFGANAAGAAPWFWSLLVWLLLANATVSIAWALRWAWRRAHRSRA